MFIYQFLSIYLSILARFARDDANLERFTKLNKGLAHIYNNIPIANKKDRMSIHSNEPPCPLSKQELVS